MAAVAGQAMTDDEPDRALLDAYPAARRLARRITGNDTEADDLAQDAWLRVWIVRYRYPVDDPPKILATAVRRIWLDHVRSQSAHPAMPMPERWQTTDPHVNGAALPGALIYHTTPEQIVIKADEAARIRAMVLALMATARDALIWRYWRDELQPGVWAFNTRVNWARGKFREAWMAAA